jgi:DNA-binding CsgD family transcriptional regulator
MMNTDLQGVLLHSLPLLYEGQTLDSLPQHIVSFLSRMIPADALAYHEINQRSASSKMLINRPDLVNSPILKVFDAFLDQHPLVRHQRLTGDISARRISDFLSRPAFHRTALYNEVYRHLGAEDQFAFSLRFTPDTIVALAMNRPRRNFTEEDRQLLNLLQPHLIQAYRNAEALTALQNELHALRGLTDDLSLGLLILDRRLGVQFATGRARRLLKKYFPAAASGRQLPTVVRSWLQRSCNWLGQPLPNAAGELVVRGATGTLTLQRIQPDGAAVTMLRLKESGVPLSAKPLEALQLTPRQAEVLLWVAQGKSNPEIAIILGTARRTVQKHLEFIFARLEVESRTAAARRALEILNSGPF